MLEKDFQQKFVNKLKEIPNIQVACVVNELGRNSVKLGAFWKRMGKLKGISDLIVFDTKKNLIHFVEMKAYSIGKKGQYIDKKKQSEEQIAFQDMVEKMGFKYFLIDCPTESNKFIEFLIK